MKYAYHSESDCVIILKEDEIDWAYSQGMSVMDEEEYKAFKEKMGSLVEYPEERRNEK